MNAEADINIFGKFFTAWARLLALLVMPLLVFQAGPAKATDAMWPTDNSAHAYTVPGNPPPTVDATNFVNNNTFSVDYLNSSYNTTLFQTRNTINYTNNDVMSANTGFNFDRFNGTNHFMAGSFYNNGEINCATLDDLIGLFFVNGGKIVVLATNISNPGTINVGSGGVMQLIGQNLDLSRGVLSMGDLGGTSSIGSVGLNTNAWYPAYALGTTSAYGSWPWYLYLTNSTPYIDVQNDGPSNVVIQAVFVQNTSPNAPYKVYVGSGVAYVEWAGSYIDAGTGESITNYLYLADDYIWGASTNVTVVDGVPNNFYFTTSDTPLLSSPISSGFPGGFAFSPDALTNRYAYMDAQLISSTSPTNASGTNPSGALTNISGRIQIVASNELNMKYAQISGQNYLSLYAPVQFDGSEGAQILSPFSDMNLGVTNGFLTITNLLQSPIPVWSGSVQAWSTRWIYVDSTGVTNDFRVLLVRSSLEPTTPPYVRNLALHATNNLVISDVLNVFGSLYIDAASLTTTTNPVGNGATSFKGELNLINNSLLWASSLPNVRWLTNNGAIRTYGSAIFGSTSLPYYNFLNYGIVSNATGVAINSQNFLNAGQFSAGSGSFALQSLTAVATNSSLTAGGDISITADTLLTSNLFMVAGKTLTIVVTNLLTDTGVTNGNIWSVGGTNGSVGSGFTLAIKPPVGDLLGTTISNGVPGPSKQTVNTWAGEDRGISSAGYTNNEAVGRLILDSGGANAVFYFKGPGASNAIYVDYLELRNQATNTDSTTGDYKVFKFDAGNTNFVIYYAQAVLNGVSVAEKMNHKNGNHLRWVPSYAGYFSSTNIVYPDGTTNAINVALAGSSSLDSDGDGIVNKNDPTPVFVGSQVNFKLTITNAPPLKALLSWVSIPYATNYVFYRTNLADASWFTLTNFITPGGSQVTNRVADPLDFVMPRYYRVLVSPNSTSLYGP